jgi:hypothetical protein
MIPARFAHARKKTHFSGLFCGFPLAFLFELGYSPCGPSFFIEK